MGRHERRLNPADGPLQAFAHDLRRLRQAAGSPTYRVLARRAGYSTSVLSTAAKGEVLPTLPVLLAYVGACGGDQAAWEQRWREVDATLTARALDATSVVVPRQLPPSEPHFVGRTAELATLRDRLGTASGVLISAIGGMAGVGKSALAVHWAWEVADRYPDGQLYLNLHGFDAATRPTRTGEALRRLLTALRVPPASIPADPDAQMALYRSVLSDKRILLVLDNAADSEQVRPLLPGSPGCLVIITSRTAMTSLVAKEGAVAVTLDVPSPAEARDLLVRRLGAQRVAAEQEAVDDIVDRCGRLPLALAVVAARAVTRPGFPLAALAKELHDGMDALEILDGGDAATQIRVVFQWSYRRLTEPAARLFRALALHPGPDVTASAAASLLGASARDTRRALDELVRTSLLTERSQGRYVTHDLLLAYATELTHEIEAPPTRRATLTRLCVHYLYTGHRAAMLLHPNRDPIPLAPPDPGAVVAELSDEDAAMAWFTAEHPTVIALVYAAHDAGLDEYAWQLAWTVGDFFSSQGHWSAWLAVQQTALMSARRVGDRNGEALARRALATAYGRLGRYQEGLPHLHVARDAYLELADPTGQAHTHYQLSWLYGRQGDHVSALLHAHHALDLFRVGHHRYGQAITLNQIGWSHARTGDYQQAITWCRRSIASFHELGDVNHEAAVWDSLGYARHHLGHYRRAVTCYRRALALTRQTGDQHGESQILQHLGDSYQTLGDRPSARAAWQHALNLLDLLKDASTEQVHEKLRQLDRPKNGSAPSHWRGERAAAPAAAARRSRRRR